MRGPAPLPASGVRDDDLDFDVNLFVARAYRYSGGTCAATIRLECDNALAIAAILPGLQLAIWIRAIFRRYTLRRCTQAIALRWSILRGRGPGHCPKCGYDVRATPERCPECGAVTSEAAPLLRPP
jgi:hypothetical protein